MNVEPYKLLASGEFLPSFIEALKEIFAHTKFKKCGANSDRTLAHRLVLFGFIGLFITTNWAVFYLYVFDWASPYSLEDPKILALFGQSQAMITIAYFSFKIFGNISALLLLIGGLMVLANRMKDRGFVSKTSSFDWIFAFIILLVAVTGILSEMLRLANMAEIAYPMYFIHLVFVFYIIGYLPFSKLAHLVYRTTAITYAKMARRDIM
jgi:quinone-modifying oxidoreductase subunit QmoC